MLTGRKYTPECLKSEYGHSGALQSVIKRKPLYNHTSFDYTLITVIKPDLENP